MAECMFALVTLVLAFLSWSSHASNKAFKETNGIVVVEAESFASQHKDTLRRWFIIDNDSQALPYADPDLPHVGNASANAYIEILPDTRTNHFEPIVRQENFSNVPGQVAILSYPVYFETPGTYIVWARAYSSGSEDNGVHFGINNTWPVSAQRLQLCNGKHKWTWSSAQRVKHNHCGTPKTVTLEVKNAGVHNIMVSMREDGFELDKFILTTDKNYVPEDKAENETLSDKPELTVKDSLLGINEYSRIFYATSDFHLSDKSEIPLYSVPEQQVLAIDTSNVNHHNSFAWAQTKVDKRDVGNRKITLVTLGQKNMISRFKVLLNDQEIAIITTEKSSQDMQELYFEIGKVKLQKGDVLSVASMAVVDSKQANETSPKVGGLWRALVLSRAR